MVFSVVMYRCENWTVKKSEHQRIDAFELWCWRRLLRVPWTARRSNQSILKEISPEYAEAETPILCPHDAKKWLFGKDPDARKDWRQEEKGMTEDEMVGWHHQLNGYEFEQALGVGDGQGNLACCDHGVAKSRTWPSDWTELNTNVINIIYIITHTHKKLSNNRIKKNRINVLICSMCSLLDYLSYPIQKPLHQAANKYLDRPPGHSHVHACR